jgi:hypothetical protein
MNRLPQWFRTAMVMIVVAGAAASVTAGSAHARPKQCNTFVKWLNHDYEMLNYWAELAKSAYADMAWDEYQYDVMKYNYWVDRTTTDGYNAKQSGCAS